MNNLFAQAVSYYAAQAGDLDTIGMKYALQDSNGSYHMVMHGPEYTAESHPELMQSDPFDFGFEEGEDFDADGD